VIHELTVDELKAQLDAGERPLIIDVREGWELELCKLDGIVHIPLGQLPERYGELDAERPTIIMCRSGGRSMQAARFLEGCGFRSVTNLTGGILAWAERIDRSMSPY
jgi:rhodanese-related sulfurtransferase